MGKTRRTGATHVPTAHRASFGTIRSDPDGGHPLAVGGAVEDEAVDKDDGDQGDEEPAMQIPAGNASTPEWRAFVRAQHAPDFPGDVEAASRDELRDWYRSVHGGGVDHNGDDLGVADLEEDAGGERLE